MNHITTNNHEFDKELNIAILHNKEKGRKLDILESIEIKLHLQQNSNKVLNEIENVYNSPIISAFVNSYPPSIDIRIEPRIVYKREFL